MEQTPEELGVLPADRREWNPEPRWSYQEAQANERGMMHVFLRAEPVVLRMEEVDPEGLVPEGSELVPMAFYTDANEAPSFRALLPPDTLDVLRDALDEPVTLGVLAEEPQDDTEIQAMVGLAVPINEGMIEEGGLEDEPDEPWKTSSGNVDAWKGDDAKGDEVPRTALLAFAPLVRLERRFPEDFGEELADLLESALAGSTRPALQARVDQMLKDL